MKGVSVIICCFNSALRLPETLTHLERQVVRPGIPWELIIVNNNSSDNTAAVAAAFFDASSLQGTFVDESNPGLSHARHKGFLTAKYEYILLCDDDNWLSENYVQTVYDLFELHPKLGIVGGIGEAVANIAIPSWFQDNQNSYAVGLLFGKGGYVKYVYGAGMGLRKSVYLQALEKGFRSLLTDRKGLELSSGGDIELCFMFRLMGYEIFQSDQLSFKHFVDESKLTENYRQRINKGFAKTLLALRPYDLVVSKRRESPGVLWFKEYCYLVKETMLNLIESKEDWSYLKSALKIMLTHQKEFCLNVEQVRTFASKKLYTEDVSKK